MADEIIRELCQIKDDIASKHNFDLRKLAKFLQEKERIGKHKVVDLQSQKKSPVTIASADSRDSASIHHSTH
jgi:hypothetical protein